MTKRKYKPGYLFNDLLTLVNWIDEGHPVYHAHKFMAAGFIEHWRVAQLKQAIKFNRIRAAVKIINKKEGKDARTIRET